jgi:hypothetical protein
LSQSNELFKNQFKIDNSSLEINKTTNEAPTVGSKALEYSVEEPFTRIQYELENRISNVLEKLELLRKSDERLEKDLIFKEKLKAYAAINEPIIQNNDHVENFESIFDNHKSLKGKYLESKLNGGQLETDLQLAYLENLQKKQNKIV